MSAKKLLTNEELAPALGFEKVGTVDRLRRKGVIPYIKLGYRTLRYNLEAVEAALLRLEVKEKGRRK